LASGTSTVSQSDSYGCRVVSQPCGTEGYTPTVRADENPLTRAVVALASEYGREDYRRITALLQIAGWHNHLHRPDYGPRPHRPEHMIGPEGCQRRYDSWEVPVQFRPLRLQSRTQSRSIRARMHQPSCFQLVNPIRTDGHLTGQNRLAQLGKQATTRAVYPAKVPQSG
jgi:hypothetical protein